MDIEPRPGEAYFYDGYTRPDARRHGLDGLVRCFIFDMLRADGFNRVYSYVRGDNDPGLRAAGRWQTRVGEIWFFRIRGFRAWLVRKPAAGVNTPGRSYETKWPVLHPLPLPIVQMALEKLTRNGIHRGGEEVSR
jgi:hypothetical protein